jgi:hypothetical protein
MELKSTLSRPPDVTLHIPWLMSGAPSDERSGLSFVLVTCTASVQFSKFAAGPHQHSVYLSVFITPRERVAQLYPQALGSLGTLGVPFPIPTIVGP